MTINSKIKSTLKYLQTLLDLESGKEVVISIDKHYVQVTDIDDLANGTQYDFSKTPNAIQKTFDCITEQMCSDCLEIDYLYKNEFFLDLVRSYIESLIHEFGDRIPIPSALAKAILKYGLTDYKMWVCHKNATKGDTLPLERPRSAMNLDEYQCYLTTY